MLVKQLLRLSSPARQKKDRTCAGPYPWQIGPRSYTNLEHTGDQYLVDTPNGNVPAFQGRLDLKQRLDMTHLLNAIALQLQL